MKMRMLSVALITAGFFSSVWAQTSDPDVKDIAMGRRANYTQTTGSVVTFQTYDFNAQVGRLMPNGVINSVTIAGPGTSVISNPVNLTAHNQGFEYQSSYFPNLTSFDAAFPVAGSYRLNVDTSGSGNPDYIIEYLWPSATSSPTSTFPVSIPTLTAVGGYWSGDSLYLDVTQNQSFTWNYADFGLGGATDLDGLTLEIEHAIDGTVFDYSAIGTSTASTGTTLNANTLIAGETYTGILAFGRIVDDGVNNPNTSPSSGIMGANSTAYYINSTRFTIVAIPEPSTYALLALGLGVVALPWVRRRFSR